MKKILVTGGLGYIGSHTVVELHKAGYIPIVIDNLSNSRISVKRKIERIMDNTLVFYQGDVQDSKLLNSMLDEHPEIQGAIHFAAYKAVGESVKKPIKYYKNNLESLISLLDWMETNTIPYFVFSSSCTVYGQPKKLPVTEETPQKPAESPYGNTKKISEEIIIDATKSSKILRSISLRYFNPIGAHPSGLIGELPIGVPANLVPFITQTAAGIRQKLTVFGDDYNTSDGSAVRDYIHVCDLAEAHVAALNHLKAEKPEGFYDVFNVGDGHGYTVLELINEFEKSTGMKLEYEIGSRRPGDVEQIYASTTKANKELNWKANRSIAEALKDAWRWQQNQ